MEAKNSTTLINHLAILVGTIPLRNMFADLTPSSILLSSNSGNRFIAEVIPDYPDLRMK